MAKYGWSHMDYNCHTNSLHQRTQLPTANTVDTSLFLSWRKLLDISTGILLTIFIVVRYYLLARLPSYVTLNRESSATLYCPIPRYRPPTPCSSMNVPASTNGVGDMNAEFSPRREEVTLRLMKVNLRKMQPPGHPSSTIKQPR